MNVAWEKRNLVPKVCLDTSMSLNAVSQELVQKLTDENACLSRNVRALQGQLDQQKKRYDALMTQYRHWMEHAAKAMPHLATTE